VLAETGACASSCGDPQRALELLERAMRLNPFYPELYLGNLAEVQFDLGRSEDAIRTLSQMRDQDQGYRLLAASHALLGHRKESRTTPSRC
jgi:adenylate cyclase